MCSFCVLCFFCFFSFFVVQKQKFFRCPLFCLAEEEHFFESFLEPQNSHTNTERERERHT